MTCPATQRTFIRDVQQLYRTIDASTDGQAPIVGVDEMTVKVCLHPKSVLNAHADFLLTIKCCPTYPTVNPDVSFDSPIFHPNINPFDGSICLSLLDEWRSCYNLLDLVKAVLYLIEHPAFDSPNNSFVAAGDAAQLPMMTARVLAGVAIKDTASHQTPRGSKEHLEEVGHVDGTGDKADQEGDEAIDACADIAVSEYKESTIETQNVNLSMTGIRIPPWRASSGRMMSDICLSCAKHKDLTNLVLLDPMALSPLSPLLNLMRYRAAPRHRLTGVLWMTPLEALSPFYHVPIPVSEEQQEGVHHRYEEGDDAYPTPLCLRFLTIMALVTNWVAWLSRMESYAALGMSRFHATIISAPMAACLLQPLSLGCGQASLIDLWPLWLLRRLLTLSLRPFQLRLPFRRHSRYHLRYLFPFSDLDEI
ncbi:Ubiquitin-conjugating enzyme E2 PEX4 [Taenia crassiceps]|uniref:Ubiquitin-conjugating enzyme E2 PEX4 n=1 Tax=Taenia crassiceps TaxID=6207 RepID=A0ABR4Q574_9CEST